MPSLNEAEEYRNRQRRLVYETHGSVRLYLIGNEYGVEVSGPLAMLIEILAKEKGQTAKEMLDDIMVRMWPGFSPQSAERVKNAFAK